MISELKLAAIAIGIIGAGVGLPMAVNAWKADVREAEVAVCNADKLATQVAALTKERDAEAWSRKQADLRTKFREEEAAVAKAEAKRLGEENAKLRKYAPNGARVVFDADDSWLRQRSSGPRDPAAGNRRP